MRVYIHYKVTEAAWGGGNSFLRAFIKALGRLGVELADSINDDYEILFFNAAHKAPGCHLDLQELIQQKYEGRSGTTRWLIRKRRRRILIYRVDGFRVIYAGLKDDRGDRVQRCCTQLADHVVFQARMSLEWAQRPEVGYARQCHSIIHNGVDHELFRPGQREPWDGRRPLRVFAANWSSNLNKGYQELVEFARLDGVEVSFCGNWPKGQLTPDMVRVMPAMTQTGLAREYSRHDVFMHVSKFDTCSNSCLEALSCGLPIIYDRTSGIQEIAGDCGLAYDENRPQLTLDRMRAAYPELRHRVAQRRPEFSMDRCAREYVQLFETLLK